MATYGYGRSNSARQPSPYTPDQRRALEEREAEEAYGRWLQAQSLAIQLANQQYQNQAQLIYNANQLAQQKQQYGGIQYGLNSDIANMGLRVGQMQTDIAQQALSNQRYGYNLALDLATRRGRERPGPGARAAGMFRN